MLRSFIERSSSRVVIRRRVPFGDRVPMYVTPGAGLRYWFRDLARADRELIDFASRFVEKGHTIWDIGANVGVFSFAAAYRSGVSGRVLSVEPDPWVVSLIQRSAAMHREAASVEALCCAVAGEVSIADFEIAGRSRSDSHLTGAGYPSAGATRRTHPVVTVTLDWLSDHYPVPNVVKIDVEKSEVEVLEGGRRLLETARPTLLIEVAEENSERVTDILSSANYRMEDFTSGNPTERAAWLTVAIPR